MCVSLLYGVYQVRTERRNLRNDLSRRAGVLAENIQESLEAAGHPNDKLLNRIVERYGQREHLLGVAVYDNAGHSVAITPDLSEAFAARPATAADAEKRDADASRFVSVNQTPLYIYALPLHRDRRVMGSLAVVYDTSFIDARVTHMLRDSLLNTLLQTLMITALTLFLVRSNFTGPLAKTARWLRSLRSDPSHMAQPLPEVDLLAQIHAEARHLARDLSTARAAAQEEAQLRESQLSLWTAERLRVSLRTKLQGDALFVTSNREPYHHVYDEKEQKIRVMVPASGLVTALEPVLQACEGTWVAHGSGNADRDVVDEQDHIAVPPHRPTYRLRRVWLNEEEE